MTVQQDARPHTLAGGRLRPAISFEDERFLMFVLDEMAGDYEQRYDDVVRLTLGKSELPPEEPIIAAMLDAAEDYAKASLVFPGGLPQLRHRLSAEYRSRYGVEVPAERFVVSVGTSMAFRNLTQLLAARATRWSCPCPTTRSIRSPRASPALGCGTTASTSTRSRWTWTRWPKR
ncbi:hypothetical protein ACFQY7_06980 [Actinomadura luteofluorescens]|uniref:hypothetical protein n=1 Tax=Actinomadura luteofluorescens TaxID=46163 RepID=UPI00362F3B3C